MRRRARKSRGRRSPRCKPAARLGEIKRLAHQFGKQRRLPVASRGRDRGDAPDLEVEAQEMLFGGMGPTLLGALPAGAIYETLIPDGSALLNFAALGLSSRDLSLADGQFVYLGSTLINNVAEPGTAVLLLAGLAGLVWIKRNKRTRHIR